MSRNDQKRPNYPKWLLFNAIQHDLTFEMVFIVDTKQICWPDLIPLRYQISKIQMKVNKTIINKKINPKKQTWLMKTFFINPTKVQILVNFHLGINYSAYSIFSGEFVPLKFPSNNKILFILDTCLVNYENIRIIGERYDFVVVIDHHTSFESVIKEILLFKNKTKKIFYCFS